MGMGLADIMAAEKRLSLFPGWVTPREENNYTFFNAPIEIGGVVQKGLVLHGGCYETRPDRHVTFEIHYIRTPARKHMALMRADWRSISGGHTNPTPTGGRWPAKVSYSHLHSFRENYLPARDRMRKDLDTAFDMDPEPQSFQELLEFTGNSFGISNMSIVAQPEWRYDLLAFGGPQDNG